MLQSKRKKKRGVKKKSRISVPERRKGERGGKREETGIRKSVRDGDFVNKKLATT